MNMRDILHLSPVIPVITIHDAAAAPALGGTLLDAGIGVIEVTLRTPAAIEAIAAIRREVPEITVGAGTIWTPTELLQAIEAGAHFGVSPGATDVLLDAVRTIDWPFLPGAQTVSEVADRAQRGFDAVKFFPAEAAGGVAALKALSDVFPRIEFCPTGGISETDAPRYHALSQVPTVGGSWIAPTRLIETGRWEEIDAIARRALTQLG